MKLSLCCGKGRDSQGRNAKTYRAGGARGEAARGTAEDTETTKGATSSRFMTGTKAMLGDCVAITEAAVEQTGQMCEAHGVSDRSQQ